MNREVNTILNNTKETQRDYLFDNLRAIFIILVVLGHVLTSMIGQSDVIKSIYYFVFFFHMPALTFISGYFSKNLEKSRATTFESLLLPYLFLNIITYIYKLTIIGEGYFGFRAFKPLWGLWYLLALFLWKFFLKDLVRIRYILPLSFLIAILSGYSKEFSKYMALGRLLCFLPFFLLGYYCTKEHIDKIRKIPKLVSVAILAGAGILSIYLLRVKIFGVGILYLWKPYQRKSSNYEEMLYRILVYVVAIAITVAIITLVSRKKSFLSQIGRNTMTVYIFHLFTIPILEKLEILKGQPYLYMLYSIPMTAIIVYLFSRPMAKKIYDTGMNRLTSFVMKKSI